MEEAPEPNDIDWEFIHITTYEKIWLRIRSWTLYMVFEFLCFLVIYLISLKLAKTVDEAHEEEVLGDIDP